MIFRSRGDNGADLLVKNFPELKRSFEKAWATRMWRTEFQDKKSLALLQKINHSIAWAYQTDLLASKSRTRILKLNGIMPGAASIESGEYPLVTTFTLVYKEPAKKEVKEFIKLVKSEFGAKLLRQNEAVPIR